MGATLENAVRERGDFRCNVDDTQHELRMPSSAGAFDETEAADVPEITKKQKQEELEMSKSRAVKRQSHLEILKKEEPEVVLKKEEPAGDFCWCLRHHDETQVGATLENAVELDESDDDDV